MTKVYARTSDCFTARLATEGEYHAHFRRPGGDGYAVRFQPTPQAARDAVLRKAAREVTNPQTRARIEAAIGTNASLPGFSLVVWRASDRRVVQEMEGADVRRQRDELRVRGVAANAVRYANRWGEKGPAEIVADALVDALPADGRWHLRRDIFQQVAARFRFKTDSQLRRGLRLLVDSGRVEVEKACSVGMGRDHSRVLRCATKTKGSVR